MRAIVRTDLDKRVGFMAVGIYRRILVLDQVTKRDARSDEYWSGKMSNMGEVK
jgi:hypothetical protein